LGSRPARFRSGPVAASAAAHGIIIAAVLMATRGTGTHAHGWNDAPHHAPTVVRLQFLESTPARAAISGTEETGNDAPRRHARSNSVSQRQPVQERLASLKTSVAAITDRLSDIHPTLDTADVMRGAAAQDAKWTAAADSDFNRGTTRLADAVRPPAPLVNNGIYTPDLVDEQVTPRPGNPKPRYPESLRAAGVEAEVSVLFVVDTTGRVDEPSIKFATHIHELFMDAIRVSLRRARFFPARLAGSVVPQLVQQSFRFELRERP
jgi:TonB family protein